MDIQSVHISLNSTATRHFTGDGGLIHRKQLFQFSLVQFELGTYRVFTNQQKTPEYITAQLFLATPSQTQWIYDTCAGMTQHARWLFFNIDINDGCSIDLFYDFPITPPEETAKRIMEFWDQLEQATDVFDRKILCYRIAKELVGCAKERECLPNPKVIRILQYLRQHYNRYLSIPQIAADNQISETSLYTLFKKCCRTTPNAYLNGIRLEQASRLLTGTAWSIAEICHAVGFQDEAYFSRCFKRSFHMTPTQYRKNFL